MDSVRFEAGGLVVTSGDPFASVPLPTQWFRKVLSGEVARGILTVEEIKLVAETVSEEVGRLTQRQLESWKRDDAVAGAVVCLIDPDTGDDLDLQSIGETPMLDQQTMTDVLTRASQGSASGWTLTVGGQSGRVYPLKTGSNLAGLWIVYSGSETAPPDDWQHDAARFCKELANIRGAAAPPSFRQLVDSIPSLASSQPEPMSPLHWEKSQARVNISVQDELEGCIIADQLPIF